MTSRLGRLAYTLSVCLITLTCLFPRYAYAQGQTLTQSELRDAVRKASAEQQKNLQQVRSFFAGPDVRAALGKAGVQYERVQQAVSALSADEVARLASRTVKLQNDFAAGALSNQELTYVVIAIAAAVLVLVVVAA